MDSKRPRWDTTHQVGDTVAHVSHLTRPEIVEAVRLTPEGRQEAYTRPQDIPEPQARWCLSAYLRPWGIR